MVIKSIIGAVYICLTLISFNVTAIPTSADWKVAGDGLITYDATTNLEWLDLTVTANMSFNSVHAQLSAGGAYDGWEYATGAQIETLWTSFGGDGIYNGYSTANNGLFDIIAPLWGDLYADYDPTFSIGEGDSQFLTADIANISGTHVAGNMSDWITDSDLTPTHDYFITHITQFPNEVASIIQGSALVRSRVSSVPEPSIALLIASGLLVFGVARRKMRV